MALDCPRVMAGDGIVRRYCAPYHETENFASSRLPRQGPLTKHECFVAITPVFGIRHRFFESPQNRLTP